MPKPTDTDGGVTISLPSPEAVNELLVLLRRTLYDLQEARADLEAKSAELDALSARLQRSEAAEQGRAALLKAQLESNALVQMQIDQTADQQAFAMSQSSRLTEHEVRQVRVMLAEFSGRSGLPQPDQADGEDNQREFSVEEIEAAIELKPNKFLTDVLPRLKSGRALTAKQTAVVRAILSRAPYKGAAHTKPDVNSQSPPPDWCYDRASMRDLLDDETYGVYLNNTDP
jgi:hypothetical protein